MKSYLEIILTSKCIDYFFDSDKFSKHRGFFIEIWNDGIYTYKCLFNDTNLPHTYERTENAE